MWFTLDNKPLPEIPLKKWYNLSNNKIVSKSGEVKLKNPRVTGTQKEIDQFLEHNNDGSDDKLIFFDLKGLITTGKIYNVVDGDTIDAVILIPKNFLNKIHINGGKAGVQMYCESDIKMLIRIRFNKINAAEMNTEKGKSIKIKLEKLIINRDVNLKINGKDKYGRFLADIEYEGININEWVIST